MKFAVTGCGNIAQIMHIPNVAEHPEVELFALLDPDSRRLNILGDRYNVDNRFSEVETMLTEIGHDLDGAIVCTPMHTHAEIGVPLLDAGIHVLLEKPISMTMHDADALVEAANSDTVAMVAYMKRYSQAFERAREAAANLSTIDLVTVYDTDPYFPTILNEVYNLVSDNLDDGFIEASTAARQQQAMDAIDSDDSELAGVYDFQLEHVCHDINLLRELFGEVEQIRYVDFFAQGRYGTAVLAFEDGTRCVIESGVGDRKWFDQSVRIDAPEGMVQLEFANPFIKHQVPRVRIKQGLEDLQETVETPTYEDSFKRELHQFVRCIHGDAEVQTTFEEARADLQIIIDLFNHYQNRRAGAN